MNVLLVCCDRTLAKYYLVKVLHLVSVAEPGLFVLAGLNDEHLIVGEHLREAVGEDLSHPNVQLMRFHLIFIALHF